MSNFRTQKWLTRGAVNVVVAPNESDTANPSDRQPIRPIAQTYGQGLDENIANAHLIAAAPEMYRILKEIQEWCEHDDLDSDIECDIWEVLARVDGTEASKNG